MKKWEYDVTSYSIEQVLAVREKLGYPLQEASGPGGENRQIMFCTEKGACFFDNIPNPNIQAIVHILNGKGTQGWQLVSVNMRTDEMICFWKREVQD
ncbi:MAG: hypothetical protein FJ026_01315 [Chloroflexi bacterium]|nr:hypothetical protein [Chloroflexota bacterium]